jgi:2-desacetyl-2-hydroxyethyl bacteriochlorophyllide A dehydrogenase
VKGAFIEFTGPGRAELVEAEVVTVGPNDLLIEAESSLVSIGTEREFLRQAPHYPFRPGYSLVGRVIDKGGDVRGFTIGDRVMASAVHGSHVLCDHRLAFKVPDAVSAEAASFATVGAMAVCAVRLAGLRLGDPLMIMGQGLIGLLATQIARLQGAAPLIVTDIDPARLQRAEAYGADSIIDAREEEAIRRLVAGLPGGGPAAVLELCAGAQVIDQAIGLCRRRGRIVAASLGHNVDPANLYGLAWLKGLHLLPIYFNARPWRLQQIEVTSPLDWPIRPYDGGAYDGNETDTSAGDYDLFLRLLELGRVEAASLIEVRLAPSEAAGFFNGMLDKAALGVVIDW